jgi:hypothetical protein
MFIRFEQLSQLRRDVFRVGFINGIVGISRTLDLDKPLNGRATGEE